MKSRTLKYLVAEGWRGTRRHRGLSTASVVTMAACLSILGVFLLASYNVDRVLAGLEDRKSVVIYLKDSVGEEDRPALEERLRMHPAVTGAEFVSKDEAWERFQGSVNVAGLMEALRTNPLPDAYRLTLDPGQRDAATIHSLSTEISHWDEVDEVVSGGPWVQELDRVGRAAFLFTLAIGIAVAISIIAIMANTVRLTILARKDLVEIMKHVGASEAFIRIPFLSEGVIQSFFASMLAVGLLFAGTVFLGREVSGVAFLSPIWLGGFVVLAVFLGFCGSALSVRGVLRQVGL